MENYCSEVDILVSQRSLSIDSFVHTDICCNVRYVILYFPHKKCNTKHTKCVIYRIQCVIKSTNVVTNNAVVSLQQQCTEEICKSSYILKCLCPCSQVCDKKCDTPLEENENDCVHNFFFTHKHIKLILPTCARYCHYIQVLLMQHT